MNDPTKMTGLSGDELAILRACRKDGKPPREIKDDRIHARLQEKGLLDVRVGEAPGGGIATFWSTNKAGEWAIRLAEKELKRAADSVGADK